MRLRYFKMYIYIYILLLSIIKYVLYIQDQELGHFAYTLLSVSLKPSLLSLYVC